MEIVLLIIGIIAGVAIGWFVAKGNAAGSTNELQTGRSLAEQKAADLQSRLDSLQNQLKAENEKVIFLSGELSASKNESENLLSKITDQKAELENLNQKFTKEFELIANKLLEEKSQKFTDQNKANLDIILNPLKERIQEFEKKVDIAYKTEAAERNSLKGVVITLSEQSQKLNQEANNLVNALKGQTKTQGNWGEMILTSILEKSGLVRGREYEEQANVTTEEGKRYQPDVVINLPDGKKIIVDSKVSLVAYEAFCSSESEEEQKKALAQHVLSLRNHIKGLSEKKYQQLYDGLDFVLMFVPIEPAFNIAVLQEPGLWTDAFEKNVFIVSTSTLMATLRTVASMWKQEKQNKNSLEIARLSGLMYDRFVSFTDDLTEIGKKINSTQTTYGEAMRKLTDDSRGLIRTSEKVKELGANSSKSINPLLVERANSARIELPVSENK